MTLRVWLSAHIGWAVATLLLVIAPAIVPQASAQSCSLSLSSSDLSAYRQSISLYEKHQYKPAAQQMRRVAKRNPSAAAPQLWLGMYAVADGFNITAIRRYFSRCIALCPDFPSPLAHYYMAVIHYTDAHYDSAIVELDKYFSLVNNSAPTSAIAPTDLPSAKSATALYEEASNYLHWSRFLSEAELNTVPFAPHPLPVLNSDYDEALPYFTLDGTECYYLRRQPVSRGRTYYARELEETRWMLCRSSWVDSAFSLGAPLPSPFNSGNPEGGVSLTADGSELYFSVITPSGTYANSDLYCVHRTAKGWSHPEPLGPQINSPSSWESQPSISPDGQTLYFASNRKGGHGGIDIWRSHRLANGDWSRPDNLGAAVNTPGNEKAPFLAADSRTLYFLSNGWQGFGGYDIYFSNLADPHANRPTNLGLPINTEADEVSFGVTADGRQAYFAGRTATSRSADILAFDLYPAARPEPMRLHRLRLTSASATLDTAVLISLRRPTAITLSAPNALPLIFLTKPNASLPTQLSLADSLAPLPVSPLAGEKLNATSELVVEALAQWLILHPMVNLALECPAQSLAAAIRDRLIAAGLRPERLAIRSGSHIAHPQIRRL